MNQVLVVIVAVLMFVAGYAGRSIGGGREGVSKADGIAERPAVSSKPAVEATSVKSAEAGVLETASGEPSAKPAAADTSAPAVYGSAIPGPEMDPEKAALQKRLIDLGKDDKGYRMRYGFEDHMAMCYIAYIEPDTLEVVCEACKIKTFVKPSPHEFKAILEMRRKVGEMKAKGLDAALDESEFCAGCGLAKGQPSFYLVVKNAKTGKTARTKLTGYFDVNLLYAWMRRDREIYNDGTGKRGSVESYSERIRELTGEK